MGEFSDAPREIWAPRNPEVLVPKSIHDDISLFFDNSESKISLAELREINQRQLDKSGESFESVAVWMDDMVNRSLYICLLHGGGEGIRQKVLTKVREDYCDSLYARGILNKRGLKMTGYDLVDDFPEYLNEFYRLVAKAVFEGLPEANVYKGIGFNSQRTYRSSQTCPFKGCSETWNDETSLLAPTGRTLFINKGTVHFARDHHFLEHGPATNLFAISAAELIKEFINVGRN